MADSSPKKDINAKLQAIQAALTIVAIVVGGLWAYMLFIKQRQQYAHLKIEHQVTHVLLPKHRILLIVDVNHSNVGTVKVSLTSADVKIYSLRQQSPTAEAIEQVNGSRFSADEPDLLWDIQAERKATWDPQRNMFLEMLARFRNTRTNPDERVVEPGESDQLHYEFILSDDAWPLLIYSYFENPTITDRNIGWVTRSLYDPRKPAAPGQSAPRP
jgi:hypothetical protein